MNNIHTKMRIFLIFSSPFRKKSIKKVFFQAQYKGYGCRGKGERYLSFLPSPCYSVKAF